MELDKGFFEWVESHLYDNPAELRLKYAGREGLDYASAIVQIECRRKFAGKLKHTLAAFGEFFFPSVLSGEQATADLVAAFHSSLLEAGETMADLTAGLGIDAFHAAGVASEVTAIERDADRAEALRYNAAGLELRNIEIVDGDCREQAQRWAADGRHFDSVFIDPARRGGDGSRLFALGDCEPDVLSLLDVLRKICRRVIIKASPMLDVAHTVAELGARTSLVAAVGTPTECKELLAIVDFEYEGTEPLIEAVTLREDAPATIFSFRRSEEAAAPMPQQSAVKAGDYIYEASPAMMKVGPPRLLAERYGLQGFHANTHLLHADRRVDDFPGSCREVVEVLPYASKVIKRFAAKYPRIDVATRNFGMSADALRAKLKVKDGDNSLRLYGLTDAAGAKLLVVTKRR